jgi:ribosomal protein S18 acetylase RimI-like enzyme
MDPLYQAFSEAFADYEMQLDQHELSKMLLRRGFDPELSFGAFDGDRLVAFTFNGIGSYQGIYTAYDTGTGTVKEYRGQGLARQIFTHSIPYLKKAGIERYLLEVLQHNEKAVNLYLKLGFTVTREFYYFIQHIAHLPIDHSALNSIYQIKPVEMAELSDVDYSDFVSSWQNYAHSIMRARGDLKAVAVWLHKEIVAYCIFDPGTGDIASLAVAKGHRRAGIGSALLKYALLNMETDQVKVINIPLEMEGAVAFLSSFQLHPTGKQFEMTREL